MRLGELLIGQGFATPEDIAAAVEHQKKYGGRLGTCLVATGILRVEELVTILRSQEQAEAALLLCQRTLDRSRSTYGRDHANTHRAHYNLARALLAAGCAAEAVEHAEAAQAGHRHGLGRAHVWTRDAAQLVADARHAAARVESGRAVLAVEA